MINPIDIFHKALSQPLDHSELEWLAEAIHQYPYFTVLHFIRAKNASVNRESSSENLRTLAAIYATDRKKLADYLNDRTKQAKFPSNPTINPLSKDSPAHTGTNTGSIPEALANAQAFAKLNPFNTESAELIRDNLSASSLPKKDDIKEVHNPSAPSDSASQWSKENYTSNRNKRFTAEADEIERAEGQSIITGSQQVEVIRLEQDEDNSTNILRVSTISNSAETTHASVPHYGSTSQPEHTSTPSTEIATTLADEHPDTTQASAPILAAKESISPLPQSTPTGATTPPVKSIEEEIRLRIERAKSNIGGQIPVSQPDSELATELPHFDSSIVVVGSEQEADSPAIDDDPVVEAAQIGISPVDESPAQAAETQVFTTPQTAIDAPALPITIPDQLIDPIAKADKLKDAAKWAAPAQDFVPSGKTEIGKSLIKDKALTKPSAEVKLDGAESFRVLAKFNVPVNKQLLEETVEENQLKRSKFAYGNNQESVTVYRYEVYQNQSTYERETTSSFLRFVEPDFDEKPETLTAYRLFDDVGALKAESLDPAYFEEPLLASNDEFIDPQADEARQTLAPSSSYPPHQAFKRFVEPEFDPKPYTLIAYRAFLVETEPEEDLTDGNAEQLSTVEPVESQTAPIEPMRSASMNRFVDLTIEEQPEERQTPIYQETSTSSKTADKESTPLQSSEPETVQPYVPEQFRSPSMDRFINPEFSGVDKLIPTIATTPSNVSDSPSSEKEEPIDTGPIAPFRSESMSRFIEPEFTAHTPESVATPIDSTSDENKLSTQTKAIETAPTSSEEPFVLTSGLRSESMNRFVEPDFTPESTPRTPTVLDENSETAVIVPSVPTETAPIVPESEAGSSTVLDFPLTSPSMKRFIAPDFSVVDPKQKETPLSDTPAAPATKPVEQKAEKPPESEMVSPPTSGNIQPMRSESMNRFIEPTFTSPTGKVSAEAASNKKASDDSFQVQTTDGAAKELPIEALSGSKIDPGLEKKMSDFTSPDRSLKRFIEPDFDTKPESLRLSRPIRSDDNEPESKITTPTAHVTQEIESPVEEAPANNVIEAAENELIGLADEDKTEVATIQPHSEIVSIEAVVGSISAEDESITPQGPSIPAESTVIPRVSGVQTSIPRVISILPPLEKSGTDSVESVGLFAENPISIRLSTDPRQYRSEEEVIDLPTAKAPVQSSTESTYGDFSILYVPEVQSEASDEVPQMASRNLEKVIIDYSRQTIEFVVDETEWPAATAIIETNLDAAATSGLDLIPAELQDNPTAAVSETTENKESFVIPLEPLSIKNLVPNYDQFLQDAISLKESYTEEEAGVLIKLIFERTKTEDPRFIIRTLGLPFEVEDFTVSKIETGYGKGQFALADKRISNAEDFSIDVEFGAIGKDMGIYDAEVSEEEKLLDERIRRFRQNIAKLKDKSVALPGEVNISSIQDRFLNSVISTMSHTAKGPVEAAEVGWQASKSTETVTTLTLEPNLADTARAAELDGASIPLNSIDAVIARFNDFHPVIANQLAELRQNPPLPSFEDFQIVEEEMAFEEVRLPAITETMAGVLIKQGNYPMAVQIYRKLILKNPEKSAYFEAKIQELGF
jgi:hypothetical protein